MHTLIRYAIGALAATAALAAASEPKLRVLVLSGSNNHNWKEIHVAPGAKPHASVTPDPKAGGSGKPEPILFTTETGGGRGCGFFLGHDTTTMKNTAWQTILQRATEWCATGKVTIPPAKNWPTTEEDAQRMTE